MKVLREHIYPERVQKEQEQKGHHYIEEWEGTEWHCPKCGKKGLWESSSEDYYTGSKYVCLHCKSSCHLPTGCGKYDGAEDIARQIKAGKMDKPTTPKGN